MLVEKGADIEASDIHGHTPLMLAVTHAEGYGVVGELLLLPSHPNPSLLSEHLLEQGADISKADEHGNTVLHLVCKKRLEGSLKRFWTDRVFPGPRKWPFSS